MTGEGGDGATSGNGAGHGVVEGPVLPVRLEGRRLPPNPTPEQACIGCLMVIGFFLMLVTFIVWLMWRGYQEENAPPPTTMPPPRTTRKM